MPVHILALPATEVLHLLRSEIKAEHGQPDFATSAAKDYVITEDFDRKAYGIRAGLEFDLVSEVATLSIEPHVERDYWVLKIIVERDFGPRRMSEEDKFAFKELTLNEFEKELGTRGRKQVIVRLEAETRFAKAHFDKWLADMRHRHHVRIKDQRWLGSYARIAPAASSAIARCSGRSLTLSAARIQGDSSLGRIGQPIPSE